MSNLEYQEVTFLRTTEGAADIELPSDWPTISMESHHGLVVEVVGEIVT